MLNSQHTLHGACAAYLIDVCTTLALITYSHVTTGKISPGVSQTMMVVYHSPASLGEKIHIVNTTVTVGGRTMSA
jgi:acyl-coenzyme A thioesterase 13